MDSLDNDEGALWKRFWKWPGIQRVRVFLWLAFKRKLLTNEERTKRGMTNEDHCSICNMGVEDVDHVLRHCTVAKQCWQQLVPPQRQSEFFGKPFHNWFLWNLNPRCIGTHWRLYFGTLCWKLWDNRNKSIFANEPRTPENIIIEVSSMATVKGLLVSMT